MSRDRDERHDEGPRRPEMQPVVQLYPRRADEERGLGATSVEGRERAAERRLERAETMRAAGRLYRPTVPEQQMMSIFATLGERYGEDYLREHKIEMEGHYVTHVDFAFVAQRQAVEVYGGPHYKAALDRTGTRQEDDAWRIAKIEAAGWTVLVVWDTELTQTRWSGTLEKVRAFLDEGRNGTSPDREQRKR